MVGGQAARVRVATLALKTQGLVFVLTSKRMVAAPVQPGFGETQRELLCDPLLEDVWEGLSLWFLRGVPEVHGGLRRIRANPSSLKRSPEPFGPF